MAWYRHRVFKRIVVGLILVLAVLVFLVAPAWLAWWVTHPTFRRPGPGPEDAPSARGLAYEDVRLTAADGVGLSGWYVPAADAPASVVLCHGLFNTRLEVSDHADFLHRAGYNVLLFDFRRHGHSDKTLLTLGYRERLDVLAAVDMLVRRHGADHPIVVLGISMGGAAAAMAAAETPDIDALILDSSFRSLSQTVADHVRLFFHVPRYPLASEIALFIGLFGRFRPWLLDVEEAVRRFGARPLLIIGGEADRRAPPETLHALHAAGRGTPRRLVLIPGAAHGNTYDADPTLYERTVLDFLQAVVPRRDAPPS